MTTSKHCFITDALTSCIEIFIDDKFLKEFCIILYFLKQEISSVDYIWKVFCTAYVQIGHYAHTFWIKETMAKKIAIVTTALIYLTFELRKFAVRPVSI